MRSLARACHSHLRHLHWSRSAWRVGTTLLASAALVGPAWAVLPIAQGVEPFADSMLRGGDKNTNEGANPVLSVSGTGNTRIVLDFFGTAQNFKPRSPILCLHVAENHGNWGSSGKTVSLLLLDKAFEEGNGKAWDVAPVERQRGTAGVTWNCGNDLNLQNSAPDCAPGTEWAGGAFDELVASTTITNTTAGFVVFHLATWLATAPDDAPMRFIVKKLNDGAPGRIDFHSLDAAGGLTRAPMLVWVLSGSFGSPEEMCEEALIQF